MDHTTRFVNKYSKIGSFPHIVIKLTELINDPNSSMREFEEVIEKDPVLVSKVLRLVNSVAFSLIQKVNSIGRAVAFIGMQNLHSLAVTDSLYELIRQKEPKDGAFSPLKLWIHSVAVAITCKLISEKIFGHEGERAYLCGILHDFGLIVEFQVEPEKFLALCEACPDTTALLEREETFLHTNHQKIGHTLATTWNMPKEVSDTIKRHHRQPPKVEPNSLLGILQISEHLCYQLGYGVFPDFTHGISPALLSHIEAHAEEYELLLEELPVLFKAVNELYKS